MALSLPVYPRLPPMQCDKGCTDCCGPAQASDAEFEAIKAHIAKHKIKPRKQGLTCPLHIDGVCSVYEVRPYICRLFGHTALLTCSKGYNTNITDFAEKRLLGKYLKDHKPEIVLHSLVYSDKQIMRLLNTGELSATMDEMRRT